MGRVQAQEQVACGGCTETNMRADLASAAIDTNAIDDRITGQRGFWHRRLDTLESAVAIRRGKFPARLYGSFAGSEYLNFFTRQEQDTRIGTGLARGKSAGQVSQPLLRREIEFAQERTGRQSGRGHCGSP